MLGVTVDGLGELSLPIRQKDAQSLLTLAKPAKFGLREKTLLNKQVRDTHEISADQLTVTWDAQALDTLVSTMRNALGLPHNARLVPHLHNLLVYEPGQFFKPHQDTEKHDGMVASLIVLLPSPHIGGSLHIHHGQEQYAFVSENLQEPDIQCIAFYSDCKHEVHEVKQGYRVALTYNLVLEPSAAEHDTSDSTIPNPHWRRRCVRIFLRQQWRTAPHSQPSLHTSSICWITATPSTACVGNTSRATTM